MSTVSIKGTDFKRGHAVKYLGMTFDRSLLFNQHDSSVVTRARKGMTAVKTMARAWMPQFILVILFKALVLSIWIWSAGSV